MNDFYIKQILQKYNLRPNFTYGQNFLVDDVVLQDIVEAAQVTSADTVLEIGPGVGNLTRLLCERAGFVLSVEKDAKFLPILKAMKKDFPKNFRYEIADVMEFNFQKTLLEHLKNQRSIGVPISDQSASYKVVANIPYYITGKILQMLMTAKFKPESITVLTQKEVAQNIVARVGELGLLAISVQLFGEPELVQIVPAKSFYPAPKVDSAIVHIKLFQKPKYDLTDEKRFFKILKACFAGKRKQIHNTLVNNLHFPKDSVDGILQDIGIPRTARPQELSIQNWIELSKKVF